MFAFVIRLPGGMKTLFVFVYYVSKAGEFSMKLPSETFSSSSYLASSSLSESY